MKSSGAMQKNEGLVWAAAIFAIVAALATMLAMWSPEPLKKSEARWPEIRIYEIPVLHDASLGGVGVARERGTAAVGWEAGGRRAPVFCNSRIAWRAT